MIQPSPAQSPPLAPLRPSGGPIVAAESLALGVVLACGLAAWRVGVRTYGYDYDEVVRAHSVWLASQGLRPYGDFFECHPPYFALLVPVIRGRANPLFALRVFTTVGNLLSLAGLGVLAARLVGGHRRWAWLGLVAVACQPNVLEYLVEIRIDGWGYALAAWALVRHGRPEGGMCRDFELGALTGIATLLFCPKLTILPALVVLVGPLRARTTWRRAAGSGLAYLAGVAGATCLFLGWLAGQGIELGRTAELLIRYHAIGGANTGFRHGLIAGILANRTLLGAIGVGVAAWLIARRARPGAYELALLAWLVAQPALIAYPYRQYLAPCFLFASAFLGFVGPGLAAWPGRLRLVPYLAVAAWAGLAAVQAANRWAQRDEAQIQQRIITWMDQVVHPDDRVVVSPPLHPIDRRDTIFVWFNTADPSGFDSERILAQLPSYHAAVTPGRYLAELEAQPPALAYVSGDRRAVSYTRG